MIGCSLCIRCNANWNSIACSKSLLWTSRSAQANHGMRCEPEFMMTSKKRMPPLKESIQDRCTVVLERSQAMWNRTNGHAGTCTQLGRASQSDKTALPYCVKSCLQSRASMIKNCYLYGKKCAQLPGVAKLPFIGLKFSARYLTLGRRKSALHFLNTLPP
jgi:hypothetical protein